MITNRNARQEMSVLRIDRGISGALPSGCARNPSKPCCAAISDTPRPLEGLRALLHWGVAGTPWGNFIHCKSLVMGATSILCVPWVPCPSPWPCPSAWPCPSPWPWPSEEQSAGCFLCELWDCSETAPVPVSAIRRCLKAALAFPLLLCPIIWLI